MSAQTEKVANELMWALMAGLIWALGTHYLLHWGWFFLSWVLFSAGWMIVPIIKAVIRKAEGL